MNAVLHNKKNRIKREKRNISGLTLNASAVGIFDSDRRVQDSKDHLEGNVSVTEWHKRIKCTNRNSEKEVVLADWGVPPLFSPLLQWKARCLNNVTHRWDRRRCGVAPERFLGRPMHSRGRSNGTPARYVQDLQIARSTWQQDGTSADRFRF